MATWFSSVHEEAVAVVTMTLGRGAGAAMALSGLGHCHLLAGVSDSHWPGIWAMMAQFVETSGFRPHMGHTGSGDRGMTNGEQHLDTL